MTLTLPRPLEGVLVLDLSRIMAGPFATQMLGDMGAVVLKVEEPEKGDDSRGFAPPYWDGESAYYLSANRSKRSLAIDLKAPEGLALVKRLAEKADVLVQNFRPGGAERLGLGYEEMSALNPRQVYVSISGFGSTGPDRLRPGYDVLAQGMGGIMSLTGAPDGDPVKLGIPQADLVTGLYAVIGTLLGLISRERTGRGQHVDTCLLDTQVSLLTFAAMGFLATGNAPRRTGNRHATIAPYQAFHAADGYVTVAVGNDGLWRKFCEVLELGDLCDDARFATNPARVTNVDALNEALAPKFREQSVAEWVRRLDEAGIPAGPILTVPQVLEHPQVRSREMVVEVEHPTVGGLQVLGTPVKLSATPARLDVPPPLLGQHTEEVLRVFLDMKDDALADLRRRGIIRQHGTSLAKATEAPTASSGEPATEAPTASSDEPAAEAPEPQPEASRG